jgi:hypothetical protein
VSTTRGESLVSLATYRKEVGRDEADKSTANVDSVTLGGMRVVSAIPAIVARGAGTVLPLEFVKRNLYVELDERFGIVTITFGAVPDVVKSVNKIGVVGVYVLVVPCVNAIDTISTLVMSWSDLNVNELFDDVS